MNRAGKLKLIAARAIVTVPSSSGCRNTSSTFRGNSGSSSRNSSPLWARLTSPGRGIIPPPISHRIRDGMVRGSKGTMRHNPSSASRTPATECIFVVSSASSNRSGARIDGSRFASIVFPEPGGPIINTLCPHATGYLQRPLRCMLTAHIFEVERKVLHLIQQRAHLHLQRHRRQRPEQDQGGNGSRTSSNEFTG